MSNYTQCQQMPYDARIWSTVFEGIISLIIAVFGLGGNIVTMFILSRPCFNDVFHRLLATLSAFDMLFLVFSMPIIVFRGHQIHINDETTASSFDLVFTISRPMARYAFFGSIYMTIVITFERYCGLVHPLRHFSRSTRRARVYTIPVAIMSFVLVSPDVLKYAFVKSIIRHNETKPDNTVNEANWDYFYEGYIKWGDLILTSILPIIMLSYCTVRIIIVLKRKKSTDLLLGKMTSEPPQFFQLEEPPNTSNYKGGNGTLVISNGLVKKVSIRRTVNVNNSNGDVTERISPEPSSAIQSGENSIRILIGIVVLFSSCHFLRLFLQCYHHIAANNYRQCVNNGIIIKEIPYWLWPLTAINHMCLVLNSSSNFLLYCMLGSKFRYNLIKECKFLFSKKKHFPNIARNRHLSISKSQQHDTVTLSKTSSDKRKVSFRFKFNDSSEQSSENNCIKTTLRVPSSEMNATTVPKQPNIKIRDDKLLTPLILHKSPATSIKAKAQIHNDSFSNLSSTCNEKKPIESKTIASSADNIKKMCSSTVLLGINNKTSERNEFICDIETIVPSIKETTV